MRRHLQLLLTFSQTYKGNHRSGNVPWNISEQTIDSKKLHIVKRSVHVMYLSYVLLDPVAQEEIQHRFKSSMVRH